MGAPEGLPSGAKLSTWMGTDEGTGLRYLRKPLTTLSAIFNDTSPWKWQDSRPTDTGVAFSAGLWPDEYYHGLPVDQ